MAAFNQPAAPLRQASLLGLLRELRLEIYSYLFEDDLNHIICHRTSRDSLKLGQRKVRICEFNRQQPFIIPWLNLMLACKTTAHEIQASMQEPSFLANEQNVTYILDLQAKAQGRMLGAMTWRHIPCPPSHAQILEVHYNASRGLYSWGDGGPQSIMSSLYQTLNHMIHYGPRIFDTKAPLPRPMRLKEVRIFLDTNEEDKQNSKEYIWWNERDVNPEEIFVVLGRFVHSVYEIGVLKGFVERIQLRTATQRREWVVDESDGKGKIPVMWKGYGFEWGLGAEEAVDWPPKQKR